MTKAKLRTLRIKQRQLLTQSQVRQFSLQIRSHLKNFLAESQKWDKIFAYAAFRNEPDLLDPGWNYLMLPKIRDKTRMEFFRVTELKELKTGKYGIREPKSASTLRVRPDSNTCLLIPALGVNQEGSRLGYGGGFYDRYLKLNPSGLRLAVCYENEKRADFASDSWDIPCHGVLTETGVKIW